MHRDPALHPDPDCLRGGGGGQQAKRDAGVEQKNTADEQNDKAVVLGRLTRRSGWLMDRTTSRPPPKSDETEIIRKLL